MTGRWVGWRHIERLAVAVRKQWHWVQEMKRLIVIGVIAVCASACGGNDAASTTVPLVVTFDGR